MLAIPDYDQLYASTPGAVIVPVSELMTTRAAKDLMKEIFSDEELLSFTASCKCGHRVANSYVGVVCEKCATPVASKFVTEPVFHNWVEIPDFAPPVLHPAVYNILVETLPKYGTSNDKVPLVNLLMDQTAELPEFLEGTPQGMRAFYEHFDDIIEQLITSAEIVRAKKKEILGQLANLLTLYRGHIFVRHLPIMDPSMHLLTKYGSTTLMDLASPLIIDAITTLSSLIHSYNVNSHRTVYHDKCLWNFYKTWVRYPETIFQEKILQKKGAVRKTLMATRMHCSYRAVIVPIVEEHLPHHIHLPWAAGVQCLQLEIINILCSRYHVPRKDAIAQHRRAVLSYDPVIAEIMQTLIDECPYPGLPTLINRNPSIRHGAIQLMFIARVKSDPRDRTIGFPATAAALPNADYDGDALNGLMVKEMDLVPFLMALHPMTTMFGSDRAEISSLVAPTSTTMITLQAFVTGGVL